MNPFDDPEMQAWAADVRENMLPKMRESSMAVVLHSEDPDIKLLVEMGAAIFYNKPLVLVVAPGTQVGEKLVQIADRIVEVDFSNEKQAQKQITQALEWLVDSGLIPREKPGEPLI